MLSDDETVLKRKETRRNLFRCINRQGIDARIKSGELTDKVHEKINSGELTDKYRWF